MSKAVLVMDMPERCIDCPCHFSDATVWCGINKAELKAEDIETYKPDWCPLRELPEKKEANTAMDMAIKALEEIQQYRAIGTVEKVKEYKEIADNVNAVDLGTLYVMLGKLQKYQSIGTVEECREAAEKQRAKKPLGGVDVDGNEYAICRECSAILSDGEWFAKYCPDCGQKVDWNPDEP